MRSQCADALAMAAPWHPWTYTSDDDKSKQVPLPHRPRRTGLALSTSVPGPGSPLPHLRRDWARPCHICTGSRLMLGARFASQRLCCIASLAAVAGAFQVATGLRDWRLGGLRRGRVFLGRWVRGALRAKQLHLHHGQRSEPTHMCARACRCPRLVAGLWRRHASDCRRAT